MGKKKKTAGTLAIEYVPINSVRLDKANPRIHNLNDVVESMKDFGIRWPIIVQRSNKIIIAGHGRYKAMRRQKKKTIPVIWWDATNEQAAAFAVRDNKSTELADWDFNALNTRFESLESLGVDLSLTGFTIPEISQISDSIIMENKDDDIIPEVTKKPVTKIGDLWILGNHRLLCGDSTNIKNVEKVMNGNKAKLTLTDPPYSIDYKSRKSKPDNSLKSYTDPKEPENLLYGFMSIMPAQCLIMTYTIKSLHSYVRVLDILKYETFYVLMWKKQHFVISKPQEYYHSQFEPIFLARKKGAKFYSNTPSNASTVFEIDRQISNDLHPTIRPLELWLKLMKYHTRKNDIVYDPFVGAGTTIIAGEKLKRRICAIEKSPYFCDVSVNRWEEYTGKKAKRLKRKK